MYKILKGIFRGLVWYIKRDVDLKTSTIIMSEVNGHKEVIDFILG